MSENAARPSKSARPTPAVTPARAPGTDEPPIVAIGASAGGLDACRKFLQALPARSGLAFILVQHLEPTHESLLVGLLQHETKMLVAQASDGVAVQADHLYIIAPGTYLSIEHGLLCETRPRARQDARHPIDHLLTSLAADVGSRAMAVILSGTGEDGSLGIADIKAAGGFVIAQEPDEAGYPGMPRAAIETGWVDLVLPISEIPARLINHLESAPSTDGATPSAGPNTIERSADALSRVIELLRVHAALDFSLYKRGTLLRRIERRMSMVGIADDNADAYIERLRDDPAELAALGKDLLIHVTRFFRDPKVHERLREETLPALIRDHPADQPLRVWVAGCSTGEETYSIAILLAEVIKAAKSTIKTQVFASDIDAAAVATARDGVYPLTIADDVSAERLSRFFVKDGEHYRVIADLRGSIVFTVQDVLADPPFSRLDFVSCRNLLIYLGPEAQERVVALFHFALRPNGLLLLGASETVGGSDGFELVSKTERLYRRQPSARRSDVRFSMKGDRGARVETRPGSGSARARQSMLGDLCRDLVLHSFAPASVLINAKRECVYSLGSIDQYLRVPTGHPTQDLLEMVPVGLRSKLRAALRRATDENARVTLATDGAAPSFGIDIQPISHENERFLLISFIDQAVPPPTVEREVAAADVSRVAELERELGASRAELRGAIRDLEISSEEQKAINEESLSVSEEYQSTNEELLTSKEELQALNEELTALNGQLHETLERQRTTANDLQNVFYSTNAAALFLDGNLNIRFFTPATKAVFNIIPSDVGRPLADLRGLALDAALLTDAKAVLSGQPPVEHQVETAAGIWYLRKIMPYRTLEDGVEGVVITFADITERRHVAEALSTAKRQADLANLAKSRFLAAASHDLRQPLQTLALLQGMLASLVEGEKARSLVARLDDTLATVSSMLNTLLDINAIEAGTVHPEITRFSIGELLARLTAEFSDLAKARGLTMRAVRCGISVDGDPALLEQMIRNLLSNALKYTKHGKILLGCRRRARVVSIEVWDTGIGIPAEEFEAIFREYHQLEGGGRDRARGLGLGLSIVQSLGGLLGHPVRVRSRQGRGSAFAIEVALPDIGAPTAPTTEARRAVAKPTVIETRRVGTILVVEDDPQVRELLAMILTEQGHHPITAEDSATAFDLVARGVVQPDLVLADQNLPDGFTGLQLVARLRQKLRQEVPVIILTGDISTQLLREITRQGCVRLNKPVKLEEMRQTIQRLLEPARIMPAFPSTRAPLSSAPTDRATIFMVDDDDSLRATLREALEDDGFLVRDFADCEGFLAAERPETDACLLLDAYLPGMSGMELLRQIGQADHPPPAIMITGGSDVLTAVQAMKAGAVDFIEKPVSHGDLLLSIRRALEQARDGGKRLAWRQEATDRLAGLTPRQVEVMERVLAGEPSKNIAADLGISQRTVENHRAAIMKRTGTRSLPALARLAVSVIPTEH